MYQIKQPYESKGGAERVCCRVRLRFFCFMYSIRYTVFDFAKTFDDVLVISFAPPPPPPFRFFLLFLYGLSPVC